MRRKKYSNSTFRSPITVTMKTCSLRVKKFVYARKTLRRTTESHRFLPSSSCRAANMSGFVTLPPELLYEITSYFPRPRDPLPTHDSRFKFTDNEAGDHLAWREALSALSRTCRTLRLFFRPQLWHRIEVCMGMYFEGQPLTMSTADKFNVELIRQLEVVTIRDPALAEHVR